MEETESTAPKPSKKIRLTRAEAYAMRLPTPRKKKLTFVLIALLIASALGATLWHFQEFWLSYWLPEKESAAPVIAQLAPEPPSPKPAISDFQPLPPVALDPELDFLSAAAWSHPPFQQGVRLFNQALDRQRAFLRDRSQPVLLMQSEEGALQAAKVFEALQPEAPSAVPLGDYVARCHHLVQEIRRLRLPPQAPPPASPAAPRAAMAPDVPPHRSGEPWQHPDYLQGARLFNQALEQYKLFLVNKSRLELLKPIEEDAFRAAKKFESLKSQAPEDVPLANHITQCYKLISDCRRLQLESPSASEPGNPFERSTAGPSRRPALPAYQPPQ